MTAIPPFTSRTLSSNEYRQLSSAAVPSAMAPLFYVKTYSLILDSTRCVTQGHFSALGEKSPVSTIYVPLQEKLVVVAARSDTRRGLLACAAIESDWGTFAEHFAFLSKGGLGSHLEVTVIKATAITYTPGTDQAFADSDGLQHLLEALEHARQAHQLDLTIKIEPRLSAQAFVVLHQHTNALEALFLPPQAPQPQDLVVLSPFLSSVHEAQQTFERDLLRITVNSIITYADYLLPGRPEPVWLHFDGMEDHFSLRLGDNSRLLMRAFREGASVPEMESMVQEMARRPGGRFHYASAVVPQIVGLPELAHGSRGWCEVCGDTETLKACAGCNGALYCSVGHQREDWPHHKGWCKKNSKATGSSMARS